MKLEEYEDLSDVLTPKAIQELEKGQILMFKQGNDRNDMKIMKIDKKRNKLWAKHIRTYSPDEFKTVIKTKRARK